MEIGSTILILLAFVQATCGQLVTISGPPAVEQGTDTVVTCTGTETPYIFTWIDLSVTPSVNIFTSGQVTYPVNDTKYTNFGVSENGDTSTLTITNTLIADEGTYRCTEGQFGAQKSLTVEVASTRTLSLASTIEDNIDMYEATCEARGGRPDETISWELGDSGSPCPDPVETPLSANTDLFNKSSVCTFQAVSMDNGKTLKCVISGHQVTALNGEKTATLNHNAPAPGIVVVGFQEPNPNLRVSCNIAEVDQPIPTIRNYYIYSNDTLIHESTKEVNFVVVPEADFDLFTNFTCFAGNYQGNSSSDPTRYDPDRTTIPPTMASESTEPVVGPIGTLGPRTVSGTLGAGAIAGIVIGALLVIIIIVVLIIVFVLKPDCVSGLGSSSGGGGGPKKHGSSSVGSSNGNDKDNFKPTPQPRQSSIKHTNENPGMAEYAMVDRKPKASSGGDMPDTRGNGAGQNEQPGMHYADLDLTPGAGHTEEKVPQNPDNVVVYSSILV